jgi:dihydroorotase
MIMLITGGRLVDPANGVDEVLDVVVEDGRIAALGQAPAGVPDRTIDATGLVVCPGLVDLKVRLREPGEEHKATMASELAAAVRGGITSLCVPPDTRPVIDTPAMANMITRRAHELGLANVYPIGALTIGLEGGQLTDMAALAEAGCVAVGNADAAVDNTLVMRRAMQYASTFGLTVLLNAQDPWLTGNGCVHEGEVSTRLGLPAVPEAAETVGVARDLALIETTGVRAHFSHLSSGRAVTMVAEARERGLPVSADVTAHHLHLCENDIGLFDTMYRVSPPLRSRGDREALRRALADGTIVAVCSDHQPHGADAKLVPFGEAAPGISGLETLLSLVLRLVDEKVLTLGAAIAAVSSNPAGVLGIDRGRAGIGDHADLCLFDPSERWVLDDRSMVSRGCNSPFIGTSMRGRVRYTLVEGRVVYSARDQ